MRSVLTLLVCFCLTMVAQGQNPDQYIDPGDMQINAEFPGGMVELKKYIDKNTCYSKEALEADIEGRVYVEFVVDSLGKIGKVAIKKSLSPSLDQIAMDAVKNMPDWKPGTYNNKPVKQRYVLPVAFKIHRINNTKAYSPDPCKK